MDKDLIKILKDAAKKGTKIFGIPPGGGGKITLGGDLETHMEGLIEMTGREIEDDPILDELAKSEYLKKKKGMDDEKFEDMLDDLLDEKKPASKFKEESKPIKKEETMKEVPASKETASIANVHLEISHKSDLIDGKTTLKVDTEKFLKAIWKENPAEVLKFIGVDAILEKIGADKALEYFS
jgi:hypothetical protein